MILGIETSGECASVALLRDGEVVGELQFPSRMTLNQSLAPHLAELLGEDGFRSLVTIATGIGPGSFTGVRMGVALAKALAHALALPLAGVSTPEAIVAGLQLDPGSGVAVLQHARGEDIYATALTVGEGGLPEEAGPTRVMQADDALQAAVALLGHAPDFIALDGFGDSTEELGRTLSSHAEVVQASATAVAVARVAQMRPTSATCENVFSITPRYVQLSQAERQFGVDLGLSGG